MKKLYLYLLASALLSIVVLGWLIDTFNQQAFSPDDNFMWQRNITGGFIKQLERQPVKLRASFANTISQEFSLDVSYKDGQSLALPSELKDEMFTPQGLLLEDEIGFYLLKSSKSLMPDYVELRLTKPEHEQNSDMLLTLLFYSGVCTFMWFILSPLAKRLNVLTSKAKQFAAGDFSARIEPNHFTYIKDVELTFNGMASKIEKLVAENKLMASSLSHDIRTPVACMRFALDAAIDEPDNKKVNEILLRMEKDLDQMEDMLKSYLSFATLEQKSHLLNFETTQASHYLHDVSLQIQPKLQKAELSLLTELNAKFEITADLHWLARAITNLLSNACDFATKHIQISSYYDSQYIFIEIEDDGPGIAPENWHKVFSPFFQEENHRNRAGKSYGLGLAIVSKVLDWHHGKVSVSQSESLGGAKFTIQLPKRPN
ncbi:two-component sensor histidine kinase [Pseudoalteromonas phenolica]|uniref:histidine kinase n=1 Tax=Pseudoalteromonas phenolica TaxID=161398 RepID=A0A5R9PZ18_9GAMM|nr:ATP-binding protein [Pseudoalteromonas phenolica]TLX46143.1 two-component sensor histidine kinase [Pseudoalteromonas phenolica]